MMSRLINLLVFSFYFLLSSSTYAIDNGQLMPGDSNEDSFENKMSEYEEDNTFIAVDSEEADYSKYDDESSHIIGKSKGGVESSKTKLKSTGITVLGAETIPDEYIEYTNKDLNKKYRNKGKTNYGFTYFADTYSYTDEKNTFTRTYESSSEGTKGGALLISGERYFTRGMINLLWGVNLGVGFNTGKGIFTNSSEQSKVKFNLWTLPLDLSFGFEIPLGSWLKVAASGGPSALGLWQSRSDREDKDAEKAVRQVGFGYAATGKLKFNLSTIFPQLGVDMTSTYDVSDFFMNLEARVQQYDNFGDNIQVSGASFGLGFTFEFL
jgi:hypothetical protein